MNNILLCIIDNCFIFAESILFRIFFTPKDNKRLLYRPGDSVQLYVPNNEDDVSWLLQRMDEKCGPDEAIILRRSSDSSKLASLHLPVEKPITPRLLIRYYLELHSPASRKTLRLLVKCCVDEEDKQTLLRLSETRLYNE